MSSQSLAGQLTTISSSLVTKTLTNNATQPPTLSISLGLPTRTVSLGPPTATGPAPTAPIPTGMQHAMESLAYLRMS